MQPRPGERWQRREPIEFPLITQDPRPVVIVCEYPYQNPSPNTVYFTEEGSTNLQWARLCCFLTDYAPVEPEGSTSTLYDRLLED